MNEGSNTAFPYRPLGLRLLCLVSFVYYGLLTGITALGLVLSATGNSLIETYTGQYGISGGRLLLFLIIAFLANATILTGCIKLWMLRKSGLLLFLIPAVILFALQLFMGEINWINTSVNGILFLLLTSYLKFME
ncbi:MAG: hypothetical protein R6T99_10470 [Bacteroidales bacterium]